LQPGFGLSEPGWHGHELLLVLPHVHFPDALQSQ
jgi:hypothetical protein